MEEKKKQTFKIIFSILFFGLAISVTIFPWAKKNIDNKVIFLILIAFIPWLMNYIKSLEILGFGKIEFVPKEVKEKAEKLIAELETNNVKVKKEKNLSMDSVKAINMLEDPLFKLVMIRVEMEKFLNKIAEKNNIPKQFPNRNLAQLLFNNNIITNTDYELIKIIWPILNKAVHDAKKINPFEIEWSITTGLVLLKRLEIIYKN